MKKEKRKSTFWLMGGLAALTFLSAGSMAAAQTVTSYNDLAWGTGQLETNITKITSPNGGSLLPDSGLLVDFATGNPTSVTLTVTGGDFVGNAQAAQGANPTTGSDAFDIFDGKVNGLGVLSYANPTNTSDLVLTFTGMSPGKVYDLTFFSHRAANSWDRASLVTLSGADAFMNISSIASDNPDTTNFPGGVIFTGPTSDTTRMPADNANGYVTRFSNIDAGSDGMIVLTIRHDGAVLGPDLNKGKYGSAIALIESGSGGSARNDLDGDGKSDIVLRHANTGAVVGWLMNGTTLTSFGSPGGAPLEWTIAGVNDLDGDGKADLVFRNTNTGAVVGWLMNGTTLTSFGSPGGAPLEWTIAGVNDLDGDGKADLVWRNTNTGAVVGWLMNGTTLTSFGSPGGAPLEWTIAGVNDLDGDGKADLVWRNTNTGAVVGWLMNGTTLTSFGSPGGAPLEWTIAGVNDLDGDGKADLVWRNTNTGAVVGWLMNGTTLTSFGSPGGAPLEWTIAGVNDLDGDGKADLVWRNTNTGAVVGWLMNGTTLTSFGSPGGLPLEWAIRP